MRFLAIIFLLITPAAAWAQKMPEVDALNRVIINHKDSIIYAYVMPADGNEKIRTSDKYMYHWYAQHDIKQSRGGFDGKLLHGLYTEFYADKQLKQKGKFRKGLREGQWKSWFVNGELNTRATYRRGFRHGKFYEYNSEGVLIRKGTFKKDKLKGKLKTYVSSDSIATVRYKDGQPVKEKAKKTKTKETVTGKEKKVKSREKKTPETKEGTTPQNSPAPAEEKGKEKKKLKKKDEPRIRIRRSIKVVPQGKTI